MNLKKTLKWTLKTLGFLIAIVVFYLLCGFLVPYISVEKEQTSEPEVITAYILTNGMHTDLVLPVKSDQIDWNVDVPFEHTISQKTDYKYIAFGWGDKGFYMDTPTWADLKFSTAFKAAFWLSESAMHCTYYYEMKEGEDCKKITLTKNQYASLVKFIQNQFQRDADGKTLFIKTDAVYGENDAFYDAKGSYNFLYTCNTWTNDGLKIAGQKAAWWTPTERGIFQHYD